MVRNEHGEIMKSIYSQILKNIRKFRSEEFLFRHLQFILLLLLGRLFIMHWHTWTTRSFSCHCSVIQISFPLRPRNISDGGLFNDISGFLFLMFWRRKNVPEVLLIGSLRLKRNCKKAASKFLNFDLLLSVLLCTRWWQPSIWVFLLGNLFVLLASFLIDLDPKLLFGLFSLAPHRGNLIGPTSYHGGSLVKQPLFLKTKHYM